MATDTEQSEWGEPMTDEQLARLVDLYRDPEKLEAALSPEEREHYCAARESEATRIIGGLTAGKTRIGAAWQTLRAALVETETDDG